MNISVLIPVYNAERYIKQTINCVLSQSFPVYEIIVLNDGSEDRSGEILARIQGIKYICSDHRGISRARNRLLEEAAGNWIAFLDADDLWEPDKLEKQVKYLEDHPECDIVFCEADTFPDSSLDEISERQKELLVTQYPYLLPAALIRKELFLRTGKFKEELHHGEDTDWLMRLLGNGIKLHKIPEVLYHYRIHGSNTMINADMRRSTYLRIVAAAARAGRAKRHKAGLLSVIIPAYNAEKYLEEAVSSVQKQDLPSRIGSLEILIIDDGSSDGTAALAESLQGVKCIRSSHGCAASARNAGIRSASGDFFLFLDADDILTEGAVKALYEPFVSDELLLASFGLAEDFISPELKEQEAFDGEPKEGSYRGFFSGCVMVKNSVFSNDDVGMFDDTRKSGETVDWLLRFREKHPLSMKKEFAEIDMVTVRRRIHLNNTGRLYAKQERADYAEILRQRIKERNKDRKQYV